MAAWLLLEENVARPDVPGEKRESSPFSHKSAIFKAKDHLVDEQVDNPEWRRRVEMIPLFPSCQFVCHRACTFP